MYNKVHRYTIHLIIAKTAPSPHWPHMHTSITPADGGLGEGRTKIPRGTSCGDSPEPAKIDGVWGGTEGSRRTANGNKVMMIWDDDNDDNGHAGDDGGASRYKHSWSSKKWTCYWSWTLWGDRQQYQEQGKIPMTMIMTELLVIK